MALAVAGVGAEAESAAASESAAGVALDGGIGGGSSGTGIAVTEAVDADAIPKPDVAVAGSGGAALGMSASAMAPVATTPPITASRGTRRRGRRSPPHELCVPCWSRGNEGELERSNVSANCTASRGPELPPLRAASGADTSPSESFRTMPSALTASFALVKR